MRRTAPVLPPVPPAPQDSGGRGAAATGRRPQQQRRARRRRRRRSAPKILGLALLAAAPLLFAALLSSSFYLVLTSLDGKDGASSSSRSSSPAAAVRRHRHDGANEKSQLLRAHREELRRVRHGARRREENREPPTLAPDDEKKKEERARDGAADEDEVVVDMRLLNYELPFDNPDGGAWKQGWDLRPSAKPLRVFVVPHSHCDPGWIKTFDEYFRSQTSAIVTTVVNALLRDVRRKFIWAEISYLQWWWEEATAEQRRALKQLLANGQFELVTGGWVQPDEANTELYAMEIQLREGRDWIREHLGERHVPVYGWSIDPFGYSPTAAYLWRKYGFRAALIQRVHYAVKRELARRGHLEFYWRQTWEDDGTAARHEHDLLTHVMPFFSYDVPHTCGPDPAVCCQFDFKRMPGISSQTCPWNKQPVAVTGDNVEERARLLLDQYRKKASLYRSNAVLIPLGDDFRWQTTEEAEAQYTNYQKIMDYINENVSDVQIQWGTLSEYFQAVQEQGALDQKPVPVLKGSFFTYSDVNEDYWSGYYTSRVFDKALDRWLERSLYAAECMGAAAAELREARRALSLFQHHDGITGTAKNHVVEDYAQRIQAAIADAQQWMVDKLKQQTLTDVDHLDTFQSCWVSKAPRDLPHNRCEGATSVVAYNPLETEQYCGTTGVPGRTFRKVSLPCDGPGSSAANSHANIIVFDPMTGLMTKPVREEWKIWHVRKGGAYLFFPHELGSYDTVEQNVQVENGGYVVSTNHWSRTVVVKEVPTEFGTTATVVDFIYVTSLEEDNQEWFVRFSGDIANEGYFHTDLNGFNFDTHRFRSDMPIQSQVFPMPTLASIQDDQTRMTVLSEHAQGTASLQDGSIDVWLDRRLRQDDSRGLGQGVQDNRPTRTKFRLVLEHDGYAEADQMNFDVTPLCRRMWDELQHPLELFGSGQASGTKDVAEEKRLAEKF